MRTEKILKIFPPACFVAVFCLAACGRTQTFSPSAPGEEPEAGAVFSDESATVDSVVMLAAHNRWRAEVGVPDISWSESLAETAKSWADHLSSSGCAMYHSGYDYGENIYKATALIWSNGRRQMQKRTPQQIIDSWASERKDYYYVDNACYGVCGHYTQIVWRDTTEVGCAVSVCPDKSQIWVCSYAPTGNVEGQRPY
uniref:CAP domain-containing protein n=1 Tax=Candidatus Electronema sp. TaxID=2698783 RepID=UPI0040571909